MLSAKDVSPMDSPGSFIFIGPPGTGKSTTARTFPKPAFLLDFGKEVLSYRGEDVDYFPVAQSAQGWRQAEGQLTKLLRKKSPTGYPILVDDETGEEKEYKTVIVDNLTALSDCAVALAMALNPERDDAGGPVFNIHYNMASKLVDGFVRRFLELQCYRVAICHVEYFKDENAGEVFAEPLLSGKLSYKLPGRFDEVLYNVVQSSPSGPKFFVQTIHRGRYKARSRIRGKEGNLPDFVPNEFEYLVGLKKYEGPQPLPQAVTKGDAVKHTASSGFKSKK